MEINIVVQSIVKDNKDILDFFLELRDKNNNDILIIGDLNIDFDDKSRLDQNKTKELLESIIQSKKENSFWPENGYILGRCKIINICGKGFTSNVYRAIHEFLGIEVALKILSEDLKSNNPEIENMFLQEARYTAKLKHPNLVSIFDADKGEKYTYMVMEFINGKTLESFLNEGNVLDYREAIDIMIKICNVLDYALKNKIIHRDIKPANIMISNKNEVKLLDLGLSKIINTKSSEENGSIVGTPIYMSPEQFINSSEVDHRTDIYSLGATFFHLITGEPPFKSKTFREVISQKIINDEFMPKLDGSAYPNELKIVMDKLLARDRDQRYQSYSELINDLNHVPKIPLN